MKKLLLLFVIAVITGISFTGCNKSSKNNSAQKQQEIYKQAIQKVLDCDAMTGKVDNSDLDAYYRSTENKVQNMQKIDLSQCPPEFQTAFIDHISAWQQKLRVTRESFIFCIPGLIVDPIPGALEYAVNEAFNNIITTWNKVLQIAIKYGVNVSKYK